MHGHRQSFCVKTCQIKPFLCVTNHLIVGKWALKLDASSEIYVHMPVVRIWLKKSKSMITFSYIHMPYLVTVKSLVRI